MQHYQIILKLQPGEPTAVRRLAEINGEVLPQSEQDGTVKTERANPSTSSYTSSVSRRAAEVARSHTSGGHASASHTSGGHARKTGSHIAPQQTESGSYLVAEDARDHQEAPSRTSQTGTQARKRHDTTMYFQAEASGLTSVVRGRRESPSVPAAENVSAIANVGQHRRSMMDLADLPGIRGAVITDVQGRSLYDFGFANEDGDVLAALGHDIDVAAQACVTSAGLGDLSSWSMNGSDGQSLCYHSEQADLALVALADPAIKIALLELRAKQALQEMEQNP